MADPSGYFQRGGAFFFSLPSTGGTGAPTTGTWKLGQLAYDSTGAVFLCTAAGTPGTWVAAGSSGQAAPYLGTGTVASTGVLRMQNGGGSGVYWRNNADNGDIGWNVGAFDNIATQGTTAVYITAGGARGTVEVLRVGNVAPAGDNSANALFIPSATSSKPVVIQLLGSQTANALEVQSSSGTSGILFYVNKDGGIVATSIDVGPGAITTTGTVTGTTVAATTSVRAGTNPAATGTVRIASTGQINWRNVANNADIGGFSSNASDQIQVATTLVPSTDSAKDLGAAALRFASIYSVIGVFGASTNVASAGAVRMANTAAINWRNAANGADLGWTVTGSDLMTTAAGLVAAYLAPASTTGATVAARYFRGTTTGAPASGTWVAGDIVPGTDGTFWHCTVGGTPGTWVQSGSATYVTPDEAIFQSQVFS